MIINNKSSNENINLNGTELKKVRYFKYLRINIDNKIDLLWHLKDSRQNAKTSSTPKSSNVASNTTK